jgi:ADP-heptose:LPS heptosyltransferase
MNADRNIQHKVIGKPFSGPLRSLLILSQDGKIGDSIAHTTLLKPILNEWPNCTIDVICTKTNVEFWRSQPSIRKVVFSASRNLLSRLWSVKFLWFRNYDLIFNTTSQKIGRSESWLMRTINGKINIGFAQNGAIALDAILIFDWENYHITERHKFFLEWLGINNPIIAYEVSVPNYLSEKSHNYWKSQLPSLRLLLNTAGASKDRSWYGDALRTLLKQLLHDFPRLNIYLLSRPDENFNEALKNIIGQLKSSYQSRIHLTPPHKNPLFAAALMQGVDVVLSPDTFAVHMASALKRPVVAVYASPLMKTLWGPLGDQYHCLISPTPTVSGVDPRQVSFAVRSLLENQPLT